MVIINSSLPKGICYIETKNLDGETNLKTKQANSQLISFASDESSIMRNFSFSSIHCEKENENLYAFAGFLHFKDRDLQISIDVDQILLRGSSLRNTEHVYGIVIYTGHDTKVMMNSAKSRSKFSKIELQTNQYVKLGICVQIFVCLIAAITCYFQERYFKAITKDPSLVPWVDIVDDNSNFAIDIATHFGQWFLIMMNFVSISLLVSLEMVKFA